MVGAIALGTMDVGFHFPIVFLAKTLHSPVFTQFQRGPPPAPIHIHRRWVGSSPTTPVAPVAVAGGRERRSMQDSRRRRRRRIPRDERGRP